MSRRTSTCPSQANAVKRSIVDFRENASLQKLRGRREAGHCIFWGEFATALFPVFARGSCGRGSCAGDGYVVASGTGVPSMTLTDRKAFLINREAAGEFADEHLHANLFVAGDCDERVEDLVKLLGWYDELQERHKAVVDRIRKQKSPSA